MSDNSYERYAKIRDLRGLTDYKVAKLGNIKGGTAPISNWKNGVYKLKDDKMQLIASVLAVDIEYLKGNVPFTRCPVCGISYDLLLNSSNKEHEEFHQKFLSIKDKYPFFMCYTEAEKQRTDSIHAFRSYQKSIEEKVAAFDKYLESAFSLEILRNNCELSGLDYDQFCRTEVSTLHADDCISQEFIDALIEKYGIDKDFLAGNEQLLARASKNDQLMRLLKYMEKLSPQSLDSIEIQIKALAEQSKQE